MLNVKYGYGNKQKHYLVEVCIWYNGDFKAETFPLTTKAPLDAILSALGAVTKYTVTAVELDPKKNWGYTEWYNLDTLCNTVSRLKFYHTEIVEREKVVIVKETISTDL